MASRVILQKKRSILISQHTRFILGFSSELDGLCQIPFSSSRTIGHGHGHGLERKLSTISDDDLAACSSSRLYLHSSFGVSSFEIRNEKIELVSLSRLGWTSRSARYISTAAANQSRLGNGSSGNEQSDSKQKKEASPEECDEAVEDLSNIKAKAKAKQLQEPHKSTESILKTLWAKILGIGPAFRAVLSMSRFKIYYLLFLCDVNMCVRHFWFSIA